MHKWEKFKDFVRKQHKRLQKTNNFFPLSCSFKWIWKGSRRFTKDDFLPAPMGKKCTWWTTPETGTPKKAGNLSQASTGISLGLMTKFKCRVTTETITHHYYSTCYCYRKRQNRTKPSTLVPNAPNRIKQSKMKHFILVSFNSSLHWSAWRHKWIFQHSRTEHCYNWLQRCTLWGWGGGIQKFPVLVTPLVSLRCLFRYSSYEISPRNICAKISKKTPGNLVELEK